VIEHGWSGPVGQVAYDMLDDPGASWSREVAARLLDDEDAVLRVYARECVDRESSGDVNRGSLVRSYRAILEELAYPRARYGTRTELLDSLLVSLRKVRLHTTGP
jgi:hypothetical protein